MEKKGKGLEGKFLSRSERPNKTLILFNTRVYVVEWRRHAWAAPLPHLAGRT